MILLVGFAVVFLSVFPPSLLVNDSFLTLVAGREVAENGLPHHDALTVIGAGRTWTDQQWVAQLLAYGAYQLGGHASLALAAADPRRRRVRDRRSRQRVRLGAGPRGIVLVFFPVILAAPGPGRSARRSSCSRSSPGLVWLLASEARRPSRRVYRRDPAARRVGEPPRKRRARRTADDAARGDRARPEPGRSARRSVLLLVLAPLAVLVDALRPARRPRATTA